MNLKEALQVEALGGAMIGKPAPRKSAVQIARQVFKIAAAAGHPYTEMTAEQWAKKWLASPEFVLTEIESSKVALPLAPKNKNLVLRNITAASAEPIIVDTNKRGIGGSYQGFTPEVIVIDGKHRFAAGQMRGDTRQLAWVGVDALKKMQPKKVELPSLEGSGMEARAERRSMTRIEAAVVSAPPPTAIQRQDRESGLSAPHQPMPGMKGYKMYNGGGPSASLGSGSGSNPNRMGFGAVEQDPSDEEHDPSDQAPGAGGGKRLAPSKGASNSAENTGIKAKDYVGTLRTRKPKMDAKAPAGWEGTVKQMKSHPGIDNPWALANYMKDQGAKSHFTKSGKPKKGSK